MRSVVAALILVACGSETPRPDPVTTPSTGAVVSIDEPIPASPQRPGDAKKGWDALTGEGYVGCGVPRSLWDKFGAAAFGGNGTKIDRPRSADLPYFMNATTLASGVEAVTANCLGCHAAFLRGKLVIGLGEVSTDFAMGGVADPLAMAGMMVGEKERAEIGKLAGRLRVLEKVETRTAGVNPADHIAAVLFAHRDPKTLAWSDEPLIPLDGEVVPVDVPAWWLLKKKSAMFHTGAGRGDQARIMMTASVFCVDDVATARAIDSYFPDIRAYLLSLEPPKYPGTVDDNLAVAGKQTFEARCSKCHGTYGPTGKYQSRIVALDKVGTDPKLAQHAGQFAAPFTRWFNGSFYGELSKLEPGMGYVPPPLDGVWATAPYLHNGSVPNLAALLDSSLRKPRTAIVRGRDAYDLALVGWPNTAPVDDSYPRWVYDTSLPGYANSGHTFGDKLTPSERASVIEYLKTL